MRGSASSRTLAPHEDVTATHAGVPLDRSFTLHRVTTDGSELAVKLTLEDGSFDGEVHYIEVVELGHVDDTLMIYPDSPGALEHVEMWTVVGTGVTLAWSAEASAWHIISGNYPYWAGGPA